GLYFFFQAEDGIRDFHVTGVQTCALPISAAGGGGAAGAAKGLCHAAPRLCAVAPETGSGAAGHYREWRGAGTTRGAGRGVTRRQDRKSVVQGRGGRGGGGRETGGGNADAG